MTGIAIVCIVGGATLLLGALICAALAWRREGGAEAISATRSSSAAEIAVQHRQALGGGGARFGQAVEISGVIECDTPLFAPRTSTACAAYSYTTEQEYEREYRTRGLGGYGRHSHAIEYEGLDHDGQRVARFWVRDSSGRVLVDPSGAALDLQESESRLEIFTDGLGGEREAWHHERCLPLGHPVYVLGYLANQSGEPLIARHTLAKGRPFLISYRNERSLLGLARAGAYGLYLVAGVGSGLGIVLLFLGLR